MKQFKMLLLACLLANFLSVQKVSAQALNQYTLQQCIDYALKNHNDVKNADLDIQSAKAKVGEIRGIGLPHINGSATITDNPQLPRMFMDGRYGGFAAEQGAPPLTPGVVYAFPNVFQVRSSGDMNLGLNQLLFDGSYLVGLKAAKVYSDLAQKSMVQTKIQIVENVTKAFYVVYVNREQLELISSNVARLDTLLSNTKAYQKQGFVEEIDVNRIEVARNNLMAERAKFDRLNQVTSLMLKFQMGMPLEDSLVLVGDIKDVELGTVDKNVQVNPENRIEYGLLKTQMDLQLLDVKNNQATLFPTLSGFAKGGYNRADNSVSEVIRNQWYSYLLWGVSLNVPIVQGGTRIYKLKQANYQYKKAENNLNQFRQSIDLQVTHATINLNNEMENLQIQKRNLELANEVVRVAKIKFASGSGSNLEIVDAENGFKQAQTNYFDAVYGVLVAKIEYQKATGTLYTEQ